MEAIKHKGILIVLSAASGTGKTTVASELLARSHQMVRSISATTRAPRGQERHGGAYFFITEAVFDETVKSGGFLEWASVHTHRYGTPAGFVLDNIDSGRDVLLVIDVQGGRQIKRSFPDAVLVFLVPQSADELRRRLYGRGTESAAETAVRLANAASEIEDSAGYDYVVVNDRIRDAADAITAIVTAEKLKVCRMKEAVGRLALEFRGIAG
ncbi:MAG: guanylate kinase [Myxococcota bacterium]|jgi:guanylate kinase